MSFYKSCAIALCSIATFATTALARNLGIEPPQGSPHLASEEGMDISVLPLRPISKDVRADPENSAVLILSTYDQGYDSEGRKREGWIDFHIPVCPGTFSMKGKLFDRNGEAQFLEASGQCGGMRMDTALSEPFAFDTIQLTNACTNKTIRVTIDTPFGEQLRTDTTQTIARFIVFLHTVIKNAPCAGPQP